MFMVVPHVEAYYSTAYPVGSSGQADQNPIPAARYQMKNIRKISRLTTAANEDDEEHPDDYCGSSGNGDHYLIADQAAGEDESQHPEPNEAGEDHEEHPVPGAILDAVLDIPELDDDNGCYLCTTKYLLQAPATLYGLLQASRAFFNLPETPLKFKASFDNCDRIENNYLTLNTDSPDNLRMRLRGSGSSGIKVGDPVLFGNGEGLEAAKAEPLDDSSAPIRYKLCESGTLSRNINTSWTTRSSSTRTARIRRFAEERSDEP
ncbi:hypothetical protein Acr_03g0009340 [Actinidia rufa]|uniref:Uncharacterized protein n=1 Tax=Actinidia rufa TaxID=165716 RepID=A0A7J0ECP6_9ERIC|nr:hypothetical protein Acr_03g0009340 [Actinidia rufa]